MDYHILKSKKKFLEEYDKQQEEERKKVESKSKSSPSPRVPKRL